MHTDVDRKTRDETLVSNYRAIRAASEALCAGLSPEDCSAQSMTEASPLKWQLAHTTWFFETFVLARFVPGHRAFDPEFGYLFNSYYNSVGERIARARRGTITRPALEEVLAYRRHVDEVLLQLLESDASRNDALERVVDLGLHHEQQHQELMLTDLKHLLSLNPLHPVYRPRRELEHSTAAPLRFLSFEGGLVSIGHAGEGFAFDNESPCHRFHAEPFELASRPVTNGEYVAFVEDGGYARPELWLSDGWDAVVANGWRAPLYWHADEHRRLAFTLSGLRTLDPDEPVCHVSYYEADAYARWAGARLAREQEWEIAARDVPVDGNFVESLRFHPRQSTASVVRAQAAGETGSGATTTAMPALDAPLDLFGDVWEWTQSAYSPYPGYRAEPGALGEYNGKFMCNQLVLRGGSCVSPRSHLRATYRNFFAPATRWQFSGIRLARDV